jgi:hypothetical protein
MLSCLEIWDGVGDAVLGGGVGLLLRFDKILRLAYLDLCRRAHCGCWSVPIRSWPEVIFVLQGLKLFHVGCLTVSDSSAFVAVSGSQTGLLPTGG